MPPSASSSAAVSFSAPSLTSHSTTAAAFSATARVANSLPRPMAAPVTSTFLPATDFMVHLLLTGRGAYLRWRRRIVHNAVVMVLAQTASDIPGQRRDRQQPLRGDGLGVGVLQDALGAVAATQAGVAEPAGRRLARCAHAADVALVDVHRAGADALGDARGPGRCPASRRWRSGRTRCRWPARSPRRRTRPGRPTRPGRRSRRRARVMSGRDAGEHGRLVEVRAEVRAGASAGEHGRALGHARPRRARRRCRAAAGRSASPCRSRRSARRPSRMASTFARNASTNSSYTSSWT